MQGSLNANTDKGRTGLRNLGNTVCICIDFCYYY